MRILIICKKFLSRTETFIYNEISQLDKQHTVRVLTLDHDNEEHFPLNNIEETKAFRIPGWVRLRRIAERYNIPVTYSNAQLRHIFHERIEEFKPDIIHCHYGPVGLLFTKNSEVRDIPIFVSFHGFDASQRIRSKIYCNDLATMFEQDNVFPIFVSNFMYDNVVEATGWSGDKKNILYYGVKSELFKRNNRNTERQKVRFLQVSSFAEKKGHIYTIRAFEKYLRLPGSPESELVLAGSGDNLNLIKQQVAALGLEDHIVFPGHVDHTTAKDLMDNAHIFVHHSVTAKNGDTEGIPNALIEAMAMELPILSTYHAGIPELVEDGENGYLVKERDTETYARRMLEISSWGYRSKNRAKVLELFDNQVHMRSLNAFYKEAVEKINT